MIVVIQCQSKKHHDAGYLRTADGKRVSFVAQPSLAPADASLIYARPDDPSGDGRSWRQVLVDYNNDGRNPLDLLPAYRLYTNEVYQAFANRYGVSNLYILSAGWGLIRGDFLTPHYDITFSQTKKKDRHKRRLKSDRFADFAMLPEATGEPVMVFASNSYVPPVCSLTAGMHGERTVFYNTGEQPQAPGCILRRFENAKRDTNWQFDCAKDFLNWLL